MKKRIQTTSIALALLLALTGLLAPRAERTASAAAGVPVTAGSTLSALPASDMVFYFDMQRFLNDTLPNFLGANSPVMTEINKKLDEAQKDTGINPRSFDSMAVGVRFFPQSPNKVNVVALAHGDFVASDLINTGFAAAQRKKPINREEQQYGGKTLYVLLPDQPKKAEAPLNVTPKKNGQGAMKPQKLSADRNSIAKKMDDATPCDAATSATLNSATLQTSQVEPSKKSTQEIFAVVALDNSTIAFGNLDSVKAAIDAGTAGHEHVSAELVTLATQTPNSIFGFSGNVPPTLAKDMGINFSGEKQMKMLNSIHKFYGAVSTAGTDAESLFAVLTGTSDEATEIGQALNGLKTAAGLMPSSKDMEPVMKFLDKLTITTQSNEVQLKVKVSQADILPLTKSF
jgi:hypothetical protein